MPAPTTAWVPRKTVTRNTGMLSPQHHEGVHEPLPDIGDPFPRHVIHSGDFASQGKPRMDPGVHRNFYTNIPQLQSIAERFFGFVMGKRYYRKAITTPRGTMQALGQDINVNLPPAVTVGDLATFSGANRERIRTARMG